MRETSIFPRAPSCGPPENGFGFYGHRMAALQKKMHFMQLLSQYQMGTLMRAFLPRLLVSPDDAAKVAIKLPVNGMPVIIRFFLRVSTQNTV